MSRSRRFVADVSWSLGGQITLALINLAVIPVMVRGLGTEGYGLYVMMHSAASYLPALCLGAGAALVKFLSEHDAARAGRAVRDDLRVAALIHGGAALLGGAVLWAFAPALAREFLRDPGTRLADAVLVLRAAAVGGAFLSGLQWAMYSLQGLRRFDQQNVLAVAQGALLPAGALALLATGRGMVEIAVWYAVVNALCFAAGVVLVLRRAASVPDRGPRADGRAFVLFGLGVWPGSMAWLVCNQVDKLFILRVQELTSLTLYAVPLAALQRLQVLPASVAAVLLPTISAAGGQDATETLRRIYLSVMRVMLALLWPAYVLLFAFMPQLLSLWLGGRFGDDSVWPARLLVLGQAFAVLAYVPNTVALGRGRPAFSSVFAWSQAGLSVLLWMALVPHWGILGAAAGAAAGQALPALAYAAFVQTRLLGLGWRSYLWDCLARPFVSSAALLAAAMLLHARGTSWLLLFALCGAGVALSYGLSWLLLSGDDRELALGILRRRARTG